jgi:hypothetical protein
MKRNKWIAWCSIACGIIVAACCMGFRDSQPTMIGEDMVLTQDQAGGMLEVGEELTYAVHYSFFNIGTIRMRVDSKEYAYGREIFHTSAFIDSNPALSWLVDLHIRFFSGIDKELFSHTWLSEDSTSKKVKYRKVWFQYGPNILHGEDGKKVNGVYKPESADTGKMSGYCEDGLSLFFYARGNVHQRKETYIPTCIDNREAKTYFHFPNERIKVDIDSVPYPVDCVHFDGRADFTGIFGLSGGFEGWFSNDAAAIPVKAKLKVVLGSAKVELVGWKRGSWAPPRWK